MPAAPLTTMSRRPNASAAAVDHVAAPRLRSRTSAAAANARTPSAAISSRGRLEMFAPAAGDRDVAAVRRERERDAAADARAAAGHQGCPSCEQVFREHLCPSAADYLLVWRGRYCRSRCQRPPVRALPGACRSIDSASARPRASPSLVMRCTEAGGDLASFRHPEHDRASDGPRAAVGDGDLGHDARDRDEADELPRGLAEEESAAEHARDLCDQGARLAIASSGEHDPIAEQQLVLRQDHDVAEVERRGEDRHDLRQPRRQREARVRLRRLGDEALEQRAPQRGSWRASARRWSSSKSDSSVAAMASTAPASQAATATRASSPTCRADAAGPVVSDDERHDAPAGGAERVAGRRAAPGDSIAERVTSTAASGTVGQRLHERRAGIHRAQGRMRAVRDSADAVSAAASSRVVRDDPDVDGRHRMAANGLEIDVRDDPPDIRDLQRARHGWHLTRRWRGH